MIGQARPGQQEVEIPLFPTMLQFLFKTFVLPLSSKDLCPIDQYRSVRCSGAPNVVLASVKESMLVLVLIIIVLISSCLCLSAPCAWK